VAGDKADLLRGTLDMLILKTLSLQPMHGLGIGLSLSGASPLGARGLGQGSLG
jgi:DNA-binding PadR family transcriptional regulator